MKIRDAFVCRKLALFVGVSHGNFWDYHFDSSASLGAKMTEEEMALWAGVSPSATSHSSIVIRNTQYRSEAVSGCHLSDA